MFRIGDIVKVLYSDYDFCDTGKIGIIKSMSGDNSYYVYVKDSSNNCGCKDRFGNYITWNLRKRDLEHVDSQMLFSFMYGK